MGFFFFVPYYWDFCFCTKFDFIFTKSHLVHLLLLLWQQSHLHMYSLLKLENVPILHILIQKNTHINGCKVVYLYTIATITVHIYIVTVARLYIILILSSLFFLSPEQHQCLSIVSPCFILMLFDYKQLHIEPSLQHEKSLTKDRSNPFQWARRM